MSAKNGGEDSGEDSEPLSDFSDAEEWVCGGCGCGIEDDVFPCAVNDGVPEDFCAECIETV